MDRVPLRTRPPSRRVWFLDRVVPKLLSPLAVLDRPFLWFDRVSGKRDRRIRKEDARRSDTAFAYWLGRHLGPVLVRAGWRETEHGFSSYVCGSPVEVVAALPWLRGLTDDHDPAALDDESGACWDVVIAWHEDVVELRGPLPLFDGSLYADAPDQHALPGALAELAARLTAALDAEQPVRGDPHPRGSKGYRAQ